MQAFVGTNKYGSLGPRLWDMNGTAIGADKKSWNCRWFWGGVGFYLLWTVMAVTVHINPLEPEFSFEF